MLQKIIVCMHECECTYKFMYVCVRVMCVFVVMNIIKRRQAKNGKEEYGTLKKIGLIERK